MNDELENQLRRALRPVDAPEGFAERLMKRLPPARSQRPGRGGIARSGRRPSHAISPFPPRWPLRCWARCCSASTLPPSASMNEDAAGRAASLEILQALRVTSQKLDLAYEAVNDPPSSPEPAPGDEENRS